MVLLFTSRALEHVWQLHSSAWLRQLRTVSSTFGARVDAIFRARSEDSALKAMHATHCGVHGSKILPTFNCGLCLDVHPL